MEHGNLLGTLIYEKRILSYDVANRPYAIIEILDFLDGTFAAQAKIKATGKQIAISGARNSLLDALQDIYPLIENEIKDDDWVKSVQANESKIK